MHSIKAYGPITNGLPFQITWLITEDTSVVTFRGIYHPKAYVHHHADAWGWAALQQNLSMGVAMDAARAPSLLLGWPYRCTRT
eukprot:10826534-Heterocapsa_arctica.AAC.1